MKWKDVNNEKMMLGMLGTTTKQWENDEAQQGWLVPKNMLKDVKKKHFFPSSNKKEIKGQWGHKKDVGGWQ